MLRLDHVLRIAPDLDVAERRFRDVYGLEPAYWVNYPGSAIVSRFFVVGNSGIELLGIGNSEDAVDSFVDRWVQSESGAGERWIATAIATDELDLHADRLGVRPVTMSAESSDGAQLRWRILGHPFTNPPPLPFLIEWGTDMDPWPREYAARNSAFMGIKRVEAEGDPRAVVSHLGGEFGFISVGNGAPQIQAVILDAKDGEVRIE